MPSTLYKVNKFSAMMSEIQCMYDTKQDTTQLVGDSGGVQWVLTQQHQKRSACKNMQVATQNP